MGRLTIVVALALAPSAAGVSFTFAGNDNIASATAVLDFTGSPLFWTGSTVGATIQAGELGPCNMSATVWFSFVGTTTPAVIDTFGSNYDTVLALYTGPAGATTPAGLTLLACNDDFGGLQSKITVPITTGTTYYIQVGGFFGVTGNLKLNPH